MFGAILVFTAVVVLVAAYIFIVNRLLRADEHWSEWDHVIPATKPASPARYGATVSAAHA